MAESGKILTLSYGGFTCALDGFDDPLQIMTAILDYLRYLEAIASETGDALAAPDIEILTGIAARAGHVEAHAHKGGVRLRAVPAQAAGDHARMPAARVLQIRRAQLDRLMDEDMHPDDAPQPGAALPHDTACGTLSDEAELALQRELAKIEAERMEDTPRVAGPNRPAPEDRTPDVQAEDDLSRIFDETDSHLETAACSRRRNAIQHLRAALAATRAETRAQNGTQTGTQTGPQARAAAQPRRSRDELPVRGGARATIRQRLARASPQPDMRGADPPPAPLWLATDQRVDPPHAAATDADQPPADFCSFAARMEAAGLPDLIEAAAVYLAEIEGQVRFSRPMLMEKLDQIGVTDMREDMLCACDALLDRGKLRKCADGRYATTDKTAFRTMPWADPGTWSH